MNMDIFIEDAIKEIEKRLKIGSFLKGKESLRKEINILVDDVAIKYGFRPEEKVMLRQEILKIYPELRYL